MSCPLYSTQATLQTESRTVSEENRSRWKKALLRILKAAQTYSGKLGEAAFRSAPVLQMHKQVKFEEGVDSDLKENKFDKNKNLNRIRPLYY